MAAKPENFPHPSALYKQVKYDNLLKNIFLDAMPTLLGSIADSPVAELLSVEFPSRPKMVADVVAFLADGRILHVEFQLSNDPRMHWRCYHYFGAIQEEWPTADVIQVVIFLGNGPMTMTKAIKRPSCDYWYHIIDMKEIPASRFLDSLNDTARVLALLCDSPDPQATIRTVLSSWRHLSDTVLQENIERLRTLSRLRRRDIIANKEISAMPLDIDMSESIWAIEGRERGLQEGEAEILLKQLTHLFGPLPTSICSRITEAPKEQIEDWALRTLRAKSLTDVFGD